MMWRQFLETLHVEDDRITSASTEQQVHNNAFFKCNTVSSDIHVYTLLSQRDVEDEVSRRFRSMRDIRSDLVR